MEAFVVVTHYGGLVCGPFTRYEDANVAAKHAEPSSGHPLKIEKFYFCRSGEKFCPECVRVLKDRGEKAESAFKLGAKLGISFKPHA